jgi:PAS domain S-box-containing protein
MRVLYVATDLRDADILQQEVKRAAPKLVLDVCAGATEARARAEKSLGYDAMLLDSSVAEADQLALIQHVRAKQIPLPIALLASQSATPSPTLVSAADECITRGPRFAERLVPGLRMAIERYRIVATTLRDNERLKRSEARLRLIIEALPAGVVLVDQSGKILAMNVAGASLVGTSGPSDVVGRELYSLADADGAQRLREMVSRALGGERGRAQFECHGPDGVPRSLSIEAQCIQRDDAAAQGSVLGVLSAAPVADVGADAGVEFAFGGDLHALADERAALEQTLESMRSDVERLEHEAATERGRVQQLLSELERARATSAEHHAQRTALDEKSRLTAARVTELELQRQEEQAAMEAVVSRAGSLTDEAGSLRQERQRLAHEADALKQELLEQRRARLELEERIAAADVERERLAAVLGATQSASETRIGHLDEELRAVRAAMAANTTRERAIVAELDATRFEASRLHDDLTRESDARTRLESELEQVRGELQAALGTREADQASVTARVAAVQSALELAESREQSLRTELESALTREQAIRSEADAASLARLDVEARLTAATDRVTTLEQETAAAAARESGWQADLGQAQSREQQLQNDLSAAQAARTDADTQLAQALQREQWLQNELSAAVGARTDLDGQLVQAQQREQWLQNELSAAVGARTDLDGQLAQALQREQWLQNELSAANSGRAELDGQLSEARARISEIDAALAEKTGELEALSGELAASRFEATQLRDDLTRESETRARLESDIEARSFDLTTLRASADADRDVFQARIAELETETGAAREREVSLTERLSRLGDLEISMAEMEARRQAAVARIAELEERRRDEQSALSAAAQREAELAQELLTARDETTRLASDRDGLSQELTRERDQRRSIEDELTVRAAELGRSRAELDAQLAAREAELASLRNEVSAGQQTLRDARESAARLESEGQVLATRLEAEIETMRSSLDLAADREMALAAELASLQQERDTRGRQAFELETVLSRERDERIDLNSRLQVLEREAADAGARADARLAEMQRDHTEVVARLQKLLEQAASREFQAAALARPSGGDRVRRRPAEKIGQLAAAMANDLNTTIADVAEDARRLLGELPDGTTSRARAEQTLQTANRAGQLVRHLLRLSERESRMIPRVEVSGLVRTNEPLCRQLAGADIDLRFELAAGLPHVECDAEEVVQVLSTFIVTVRGALPLGGVIRVSTQDRGRGDGRRRRDQALVLSVTAEGYGMVPVPTAGCEEVASRIGGTFSTTTDSAQSVTTLQVTLPTEARTAEAGPGWSQTA